MNEDEYTTKVVMPFLRQLGYSEVTHNHGIGEFGKDVVFAEYDRFGNKIHHGAQVKVGDLSGANNSKVEGLISHIVKAFDMPFDDLITKAQVRLSHFFVIISGRFKSNARKALVESTRLSPYIHRLYLYEGHHIQELETRAFRELRSLLAAQLAELSWNKAVSHAVAEVGPLTVYSTSNLTRLISALSVADRFASLVWELRVYQAKLLRQNRLITLLPVLKSLHGDENEMALLKSETGSVEQLADKISSLIRAAIGELGP